MPTHPTLTVREIVLGLAAGAVAAGGAAAMLSAFDDDEYQQRRVVVVEAAPQNYDVAPFTEVSTMGPHDVVITYGETQSIRAEGAPEVLARLEAVVVDGELRIRPKRPSFNPGDGAFDFSGFDWESVAGATFYITVPRLERVSLAGSGDVSIDRIEGERFEGRVAGPGELSIGTLQADKVDFSIGGSGTLTAAGVADETRVSIGGSGEIDADNLRTETASISIGGSGDVALTVDSRALISIAGSGNVDITGPATCSVSRMGSGAVSCNGVPQ
jgi:hypothetical protein